MSDTKDTMAAQCEELVNGSGVEHDASGVGHAWRTIDATELPANIVEEIATWIVEIDPNACDEYEATNGQTYRMPDAE